MVIHDWLIHKEHVLWPYKDTRDTDMFCCNLPDMQQHNSFFSALWTVAIRYLGYFSLQIALSINCCHFPSHWNFVSFCACINHGVQFIHRNILFFLELCFQFWLQTLTDVSVHLISSDFVTLSHISSFEFLLSYFICSNLIHHIIPFISTLINSP